MAAAFLSECLATNLLIQIKIRQRLILLIYPYLLKSSVRLGYKKRIAGIPRESAQCAFSLLFQIKIQAFAQCRI